MQLSRHLLVLGLLATSLLSARGAIYFSGNGGAESLSLTITEDIVFTLTSSLTEPTVVFHLNGVYSPGLITGSNEGNLPPSTPYASGIKVDLVSASNGNVTSGSGYENWGVLALEFGVYDSEDFFGMIRFATTPTSAIGDTVIIRAGTVVFDGHALFGVPAPDQEVTSIQLMSSNFDAISASQTVQAVPEPGTFVLAGLGLAAALACQLRRRRQPLPALPRPR